MWFILTFCFSFLQKLKTWKNSIICCIAVWEEKLLGNLDVIVLTLNFLLFCWKIGKIELFVMILRYLLKFRVSGLGTAADRSTRNLLRSVSLADSPVCPPRSRSSLALLLARPLARLLLLAQSSPVNNRFYKEESRGQNGLCSLSTASSYHE